MDRQGSGIHVSIHQPTAQTRRLPAQDRRARVLASLCVQDQLVPDSWNPLDANFVWNKHWRARRMAKNPAAKALFDQAMTEFRRSRARLN